MISGKLENLINYTNNGIFVLINEAKKKVDVRYGSNLLRSASVLAESIRAGSVEPLELKQDLQQLELVVLQENVADLKLCHSKWMKYYKDRGYSLYRTRPARRYNTVILIDYVPQVGYNKLFFIVKLVSKRNSIITGIFDNDIELQTFLSEYYNKDVHRIVFAKNKFTATYLENTVTGTVIP